MSITVLSAFVLKTKYIVLIVVACLLLVGVVSYFSNLQRNRRPVEVADSDSVDEGDGGSDVVTNESGVVGGVRRPATDFPAGAPKTSKGSLEDDPFLYGVTPGVAVDANPEVAKVVEAIRNRAKDPEKYASAVSIFGKPSPFDLKRYRSDKDYRKQYLTTVEPSRVFSPAQPGTDVIRIQPLSPREQDIVQGERLKLRVAGVPDSPISFTSMDLGRFVGNELTSITVNADSRGVAEVEFTAPPGTINRVNIMAASPVASGQVRLVVNVSRPQQ